MAKADLTAQRLRELAHYNPDTGEFWRIPNAGTYICKGPRCTRLGSLNRVTGYVFIGIDGLSNLYAHRLAWLYMTGEWPKLEIDHVNGDRADNRFCNLRDVPTHVNAQNKRASMVTSRSGLLGVSRQSYMSKSGEQVKWNARIETCGRRRYIGTYATPEEAHAAYLKAKREQHEGCTI
jgi:hypothetical protein